MNQHRTSHEISRDQLRRELRDASADATSDTKVMGTALRAVLDGPATADERLHAIVGRRRFLQIGGFSVATASVLAACAGAPSGGLARVGVAPTTTALPDPVINDAVLLRTASSIEHSAIAVYDAVIDADDLLDPAYGDVVKRFRDDHAGHAALFEQLTAELGAEPWTCGNPRVDELLIPKVLRAITGGAASGSVAETPPSDDPRRDVLNFAHALETLAGASYQSLVPLLSDPALRKETIAIGTHEVRHAALLAVVITGRPDGYVPAAEAGDPPAIPMAIAIPSQFGSLAATPLVVGAENEAGARTTFSLDTPSLNTYVYEYMTPEC